jgi:hypothetical protein
MQEQVTLSPQHSHLLSFFPSLHSLCPSDYCFLSSFCTKELSLLQLFKMVEEDANAPPKETETTTIQSPTSSSRYSKHIVVSSHETQCPVVSQADPSS